MRGFNDGWQTKRLLLEKTHQPIDYKPGKGQS